MVENFNGIIYLIIFIIITGINIFYSYKTVFDAKNFLKKFNTPVSALFFTRGMGSIITSFSIIGIYILFRGTEGTWAYFGTIFVAYVLMTITGFYSVEIDYKNIKDSEEMKNVIVTKEGYIPTGILAILTAILIYGLSDKIYT